MKNKIIFLICIVVLGLFGCNKPDLSPPSALICLQYPMTQCNDEWGQYKSSQFQPKVFFETYFNSLDIPIFFDKIIKDENNLAVCLACTCPTGETLVVLALPENVEKLVKKGFKKCNDCNSVLCGRWKLKTLYGGITGSTTDVSNMNFAIEFTSDSIFTYQSNTLTFKRSYKLGEKKKNWEGELGLYYDGSIETQENFSFHSDSLLIYETFADGYRRKYTR